MMDQQKYLRQLCTRNKQVSGLGKHGTLTFKDDETFYFTLSKGTIISLNFT